MEEQHDIWKLNEEDGQINLNDEVLFIENLHEIPTATDQAQRLDYNTVVHCRGGRVELEVSGDGSKKVTAHSGQLLLFPAKKLLQPMMVSTDAKISVLLVSDKVLRRVLGPQIDIWNRAMFLSEIYVIDGGVWVNSVHSCAETIFRGVGVETPIRMVQDIALSFLRTMFLMVCEMLTRQIETGTEQAETSSTHGERHIFDQFLTLISKETQKRQPVSHYASLLNITPKYLSTVCKNVSGKSPSRWITESVMEDIYEQLRNTNLSVKEISNRMGFPNSSFFGQYFREEAGMTPLEYRTKIKSCQ